MDAHKESLRPHNKYEKSICAEKEEGVSVVQRRKGGCAQVHF